MEMSETIDLMQSADYKDRYRAEYYQTKIRCEKLRRMLCMYDAGTLSFMPNCEIRLLKDQFRAMDDYLYALEVRAEQEKIQL